MYDVISRSDAIEALNQHSYENSYDYDMTVALISEVPSIDAAPVVHGRWKRDNTRRKSYRRLCTACGKVAYNCFETCDYNYCPNCGAKMDGEDQG